MDVTSALNHLHIAPRKIRLVAHLIKGMDVKRAEMELRVLPKRSTIPLLKLLKSAVANARHNFQLGDEAKLYIRDITVNPGPVLKRTQPRAFGKAALVRKRTSHILLVLATRGSGSSVMADETHTESGKGPVERDFEPGDAQRKSKFSKQEKEMSPGIPRKKTASFVKRVFQRKAI